MRTKKKIKFKVFFMALNILLCTVLMLSSTYALFSHLQQPEMSISAGDIDMDLLVYTDGEYKSVEQIDENIFGEELWEPNQTRIVYFKIVSESNLDAKYSLQFLGELGALEGAFEYCVIDTDEHELTENGWEELSQNREVFSLNEGINYVSGTDYIAIAPGEERYLAVALHMGLSSGNEYQAANVSEECEITVRLYAVQGNAFTILE